MNKPSPSDIQRTPTLLSHLFYQEVQSWIGTPFAHQMQSKGMGADCLGLVIGAYRNLMKCDPFHVPPYAHPRIECAHFNLSCDFLKAGFVESNRAKMGHVVVFELKPRSRLHLGVLSEAGEFIHSHVFRGVERTPLRKFWQERILQIFKIKDVNAWQHSY